ncbi:MAG: glycerate kinase [Deltaproteobacteria bacterium]|nr:glycerate kinase [Deltaproteobacteria bacterium]
MTDREKLLTLFKEALAAVLPGNLVREALRYEAGVLSIQGKVYPLARYRNVYLFGSGKAAVETARAVKALLGDRITGGLIVSPYAAALDGIDVWESSHPLLSEKSLQAADRLREKIASLAPDDFFIYLLSGGSSALVEKPVAPITLDEMQTLAKALLAGGVPIGEMNIVRKHLSLVKGGRLGRLSQARGIVLAISDVIGDDLEAIGSAPLFFDRSGYGDVLTVLKKYGLWETVPGTVRQVVEKGLAGELAETPKTPNRLIDHVLIGSNGQLLRKAEERALALGIPARIMTSRLRGEARKAAKAIMALGEKIAATGKPFAPPVCLLFGGETTVTLRGDGRGGRNQEMALAALGEIRDNPRFVFLSAGTDGIDGRSDAAGAIVDRKSWEKAQSLGLSIAAGLARNDSYRFFQETGDLIVTGPTGTNVMDMTALYIK